MTKAHWGRIASVLVIGSLMIGLNLGGGGGCKEGGGGQQVEPEKKPTGKTNNTSNSATADIFVSGPLGDVAGTSQTGLTLDDPDGLAALTPATTPATVNTDCLLNGNISVVATLGAQRTDPVSLALSYNNCVLRNCLGDTITLNGSASGAITSVNGVRTVTIGTQSSCAGVQAQYTNGSIVDIGFNLTRAAGQLATGTVCVPPENGPPAVDLVAFRNSVRSVCRNTGSAGTSGRGP